MENIEIVETTETENKKLFFISKIDAIYIVILTITSILLSFLGITSGFRGGFAVTNIPIILSMVLFIFKRGYKFKINSVICLVEIILLSGVFLVTSNGVVRFFSFAVMTLISLLLFYTIVKNDKDKSEFDFFSSMGTTILDAGIANIPVTARSLFADDKNGKKIFSKALIGIAASLPVLIVVIPLLMASDEAFSGLIKIFGENVFLIILKAILGLVIAFVFISFCLSLKNNGVAKSAEFDLKKIDKTVLISFLSSISVCYILYLVSQLAYFFSAFKGLLPSDYSFTLATYARRGFFEMCIIAVINFCLIFCTHIFAKENNIVTKILNLFICLFTLIIIITAVSKMFLYINNFGMTKLRILTTAFMLFLAIMFIALSIKIFVSKLIIVKFGIALAGVFLIVLGLFNVNSFIAEYNYNAYKENKLSNKIDVKTIYELGDEGIPYLIYLCNDVDVEVNETARDYLFDCYINDYYEVESSFEYNLTSHKIIEKKYAGVGEYSISRAKAYKLLDKFIEDSPGFLNKYDGYDYNDDLYNDNLYSYDTNGGESVFYFE